MRRRSQSGYVIMVLLFMMALLLLAVAASAPAVKQQLQRDREEEMIHRGAQYARAIKRYFKKFGRYPTSLDQLENTNNIRFLRKRYADPMSPDGKWNLLHVGDVKLGATSNIGSPVSAMASPTGALGPGMTGAPGLSSTSQAAQATAAASGFIGSQPAPAGKPSGSQTSSSTASSFGASAVFGGAVIGVASSSEKEGLHEFNEKTHYNEWYFFYDPTADRGGLINGPFTGKTFANPGAAIGTPAGSIGRPAGQPNTFGQPSSFGQPGSQGGFGQPQFPQQQPPPPPQ